MFSSFTGSFSLGRRRKISAVVGGDMRSLLSASGQSAYDAASTDNWFSVSSTDYAAVAAGLSSVTKYAMNDSLIAENGSLWSANYAQAMPSTIGTVPANVYLFGFMTRCGAGGTTTPLISTTFRGTYTAISNSPNAPASNGTRGYYLRKASTATSAISYLGVVNTTSSYLTTTTFNPPVSQMGGYDATTPYSTWTQWNSQYLIFQMLGTSTHQWA